MLSSWRLDHLVRQDYRLSLDLEDERPALAGLLGHRPLLLGGFRVGRRGPVPGRRHQVLEDAGRAHDRRGRGVRERYADHLDPEERGVGILVGRGSRTAGQLLGGPHRGRAGHVDVDVVVVAGMIQHGVGVRAPARLHVRDVLGIGDVGDVEDADAADPLVAHRLLNRFVAAVQPSPESLARHEEQVVVHRHVALRGGTVVGDHRDGTGRIGDVPHLDPVVVALDGVPAGEGEVGIRAADERLAGRRRGQHAEVPDRLAGVEHSGGQTDARVRRGRVDRQAGRIGERRLRPGGPEQRRVLPFRIHRCVGVARRGRGAAGKHGEQRDGREKGGRATP